MRRIRQYLQPELTVLIISQRQHELVEQLRAGRMSEIAPEAHEGATHLSILRSSETRFVGCFREAKTGQARRDDVEAGTILTAFREQREHLPHFEEVAWP